MSEDERTLWAGNLSDRMTEELLYELFLQVGPLEKVFIPKDKQGRQNTYGFVIFKHTESVPYAIKAMELVKMFGRRLTLKQRRSNNPQNVDNGRNSPRYRGSAGSGSPNADQTDRSPLSQRYNQGSQQQQNYNNYNQQDSGNRSNQSPQRSERYNNQGQQQQQSSDPDRQNSSQQNNYNNQGWFNQETFMPQARNDGIAMQAVRNRIAQSTRLMHDTQQGRQSNHRQHRDKFYDRPSRR